MIQERFLNPRQYVQDSKFVPNQIVLHHTAGGTAESTIRYWDSNREKVCTHFIIDRDGTIIQTVPLEKAWAYHLYVASPGNKISRTYRNIGSRYDRQSIGIELCSYGQLKEYNGKLLTYFGMSLPREKSIKLDVPFKGYTYFENYTSEQIQSLEYLLKYLLDLFPQIDNKRSDYSDIFDINVDALNFVPGIFTHVSYRTDKADCNPNLQLIQMLNNL